MTSDKLKLKTKKALLEIATDLKIKGVKTLKKDALVTKILKAQAVPETYVQTDMQSPIVNDTASSWSSHHESEQQTVKDSKFYEGFVQQSFPQQDWMLPKNYGDTKIVLMMRDPNWLFAYWEINDHTRYSLKEMLGGSVFENSRVILRVYDITDIKFNGENANSSFDLEIGNNDRWYINVPEVDRSYCVEVGFRTPDGRFIMVARSNTVLHASDTVSDVIDEEWMSVEGKTYFDRMYALSGGFNVGRSSGELVGERKELLTQRLEGVLNLTSGELKTSELNLSSEGVSSLSSPMGRTSEGGGVGGDKAKDFWLVANTELIVYGATEPDASVTVCGHQVKLKADGTFCLRFALPDGTQNIPIEAINNDGDEQREITFEVKRQQS